MRISKIWCLGVLSTTLVLNPVVPSHTKAPGISLMSQYVEQEGIEIAERDALNRQLEASQQAQAAQEAAKKAEYDRTVTSLVEYTKLNKDIIEYLIKQVEESELPLHIVCGLIDLESSWNINDRNESSGATGLGQIMPGTARGIAEGNGWEDKGHSYTYYQQKLKDPYYNIRLTVAALDDLRSEYGDDWNRILTGYNRGTGGLQSWIRQKGTPVSVYSKVVMSRAHNIEDVIGAV